MLCVLCIFSCFVLPSKAAVKYKDVKSSDWYYGVVNQATDLGFMGKTDKRGGTYFEPNQPMSRGMVATVLYRMAGTPSFKNTKSFKDVKEGLWYTKAIQWATSSGVLNGYDTGKFGPDDPVTREQLAVMLRNFAKYQGRNVDTIHRLVNFKDHDKISDFAFSALGWACDYNILNGSEYNNYAYLKPTQNATRAECAKMFVVYSQINWEYNRGSYYKSLQPILKQKMEEHTAYYWCDAVNGDGTYDGGVAGLVYAGFIDLNKDTYDEFIVVYGGEEEVTISTRTTSGTVDMSGYYVFELYKYDKKSQKATFVDKGIIDFIEQSEDSSSISICITRNWSYLRYIATSCIRFNESLNKAYMNISFLAYGVNEHPSVYDIGYLVANPYFTMEIAESGYITYYINGDKSSESDFYSNMGYASEEVMNLYPLTFNGKTLDEINSKMISFTSASARLGCGVYDNLTKKNLVDAYKNDK